MPPDDNVIPIGVLRLLLPGETARRVPGASRYWVTSFGRVISTVRGANPYPLKPWLTKKGYPQVALVPDDREPGSKRRWRPFVHALVLTAFHGPRPTDEGDPHACFDACHDDGLKTNNHVQNLRWARREVNRRDNFRQGYTAGTLPGTGFTPVGVFVYRCRALTEPLCALADEGAEEYGLTPRSVRDAIRGRMWPWVPSPHDPPALAELARVLGVSDERAAELLALAYPGGRRAA